MSSFYKLNIKEVKRETANAVSILFNVPETLQTNYQFIAGQYLNLKLTLDGNEIRRAYSICESPESGELRIAVKAVKNGAFSTFANSNLKTGDTLEVGKPEGNFTFEPQIERQKNYAAFVAGSGITPVMSILKSILISEPKSTFVLVYGNKSAEETIFHQELHDLQLRFVGRLFAHYVFSESKIEEMINTVSSVLKEHNVAEKNIKFELFTSSSTENDIKTSVEGHTKITVLVDSDETTFEMSQKQTILEAALKQGVDAPYSCQGGICSSCLGRLTKGTAEMRKNSILTDSEIASGLILTCQAVPTSSEIYVDYDDV